MHDNKKKEKREKKKRPRDTRRTLSPPPPATEISTPREMIATFPHLPLFSHDGYCLGVDVKPSTLLFWGPLASPPWGSCSCSSLTHSGSSVLPLTLQLVFTWLSILRGRKVSRFVHGPRYGVGLSVEVGHSLQGLYLWWGKLWLVTSRSRLGLVVVPQALAMACLSVVARPFAILPPRPS